MQYSVRFLLTLLVCLSAANPLMRLSGIATLPALAQTESFALPETVPAGTTLAVESSPNMAASTRALQEQFETRYDGSQVTVEESSSDQALQALLAGDVDLAAIGRPLTEAELEQGLVSVPLLREKIAIIIGPDNPFDGTLTFEQFAGMFRGEITDWSEVGGPAGPIRFIDRPADSDTRRSLSQYEVFQQAPFESGATAAPVDQDDTAMVIQSLGTDGIGYAIAPHVIDQAGVKIVPMHDTLPDNPNYPYSQPRYLVYRDMASPAVAAFLGYATSTQGAAALAAAQQAETAAIANALGDAPVAPTTEAAATAETVDAAVSPEGAEGETVAGEPTAAEAEATEAETTVADGTVTETESVDGTAATESTTTDDQRGAGWLWWLLPLAGAGALAWWLLGRGKEESAKADVVAVSDTFPPLGGEPDPVADAPTEPATASTRVADSPATAGMSETAATASPTAAPATDGPQPVTAGVVAPGGDLTATSPSMADGNGSTSPSLQPVAPIASTASAESSTDSGPDSEPDMAEPATNDAPSSTPLPTEPGEPAVNFPSSGVIAAAGVGGLAASAAASVAGTEDQSAIEASKYNVVGRPADGDIDLSAIDDGLPPLPDGYGESRIVLMARDPQWAYAYWDTPSAHKESLRNQGGERLAVRLFDVTDIDLAHQAPHSMQQFDCDELAREWYLQLPISDRDYMVEIGYLTGDGRWLLLAQSNTVRIPPVYPSDWQEDHFMTVGWQENLKGKTLITLVDPRLKTSEEEGLHAEMYALSQPSELQRIAGSLFGSMQHVPGSVVPQQSLSSYIFPSGVGMGMVPTMSGINMSGVGFSASAPPIRPRQFWLVADAELIVYGATEPDATVTIGGTPIQLTSEGTFRFQTSFQDGTIEYPIMAVAADGEQSRWVHMTFERQTPERRTNTREEAQEEWPETPDKP
jgi:ABC-type phosphate transport system substrate-binding protein